MKTETKVLAGLGVGALLVWLLKRDKDEPTQPQSPPPSPPPSGDLPPPEPIPPSPPPPPSITRPLAPPSDFEFSAESLARQAGATYADSLMVVVFEYGDTGWYVKRVQLANFTDLNAIGPYLNPATIMQLASAWSSTSPPYQCIKVYQSAFVGTWTLISVPGVPSCNW